MYGRSLQRFPQTVCKLFLVPQRVNYPCFYARGCATKEFVVPLFVRAQDFLDKTAVIDHRGSHTFAQLLLHAAQVRDTILENLNSSDFRVEPRVSLLTANDADYVSATWGAWLAGAIPVPLYGDYPPSVLDYYVTDSGSSLILASESLDELAKTLAQSRKSSEKLTVVTIPFSNVFEGLPPSLISALESFRHRAATKDDFRDKRALMIYSSGTTGPPKGVVLTFGSIDAQMKNMVAFWSWKREDLILHTLPLHHVHGIVNCLFTPLSVGATVHLLERFSPNEVMRNLLNPIVVEGNSTYHSIFMAVPTIYVKLLNFVEEHMPQDLSRIRKILDTKVRLMVSGSAALPTPVAEKWEIMTGHRLLERYGMTEIGMALSNPLFGERRLGAVGIPMPSVRVAVACEDTGKIEAECSGKNPTDIILNGKQKSLIMGELLVKGPSLFSEYWQRPQVTKESFTADGWFKTGDTCVIENGYFRIFGRTSVDVIKSGGYKISALDVERHLLSHPDITDVAVVGVSDREWGERVGAIIVTSSQLTLEELRVWGREVMPVSWIPSLIANVESIPRNAMGKMDKKSLVKIFE